ncbi:MAG: hypothetical protein HC821_05525 [Lewinella sp.]|nr:hypothetical protein [Lewinella sp.]
MSGFPRTLATDERGRIYAVTMGEGGTILYEYTLDGFAEIGRLADSFRSIATPTSLLPLRNGQFVLFDVTYGLRYLSAQGLLLGEVSLANLQAEAQFTGERYERLSFLVEGPDGGVYFSFSTILGCTDGSPKWEGRPCLWLGCPLPTITLRLFKTEEGSCCSPA